MTRKSRWWVFLAFGFWSIGCRAGPDGAIRSETATPTRPPGETKPIVVRADDRNLVYRFWDPATNAMHTSKDPKSIPEAARASVLVYDERRMLAESAGMPVTVADLTTARADGTYPTRLVDIAALEQDLGQRNDKAQQAKAAAAAAAPGPGDVVLFSTQGCPHCRTARNWLKSKNVVFVEKDVERDPTARTELMRIGQQQGIEPTLLQAVPILLVRGKLVLGWNAAEVQRLLGL